MCKKFFSVYAWEITIRAMNASAVVFWVVTFSLVAGYQGYQGYQGYGNLW
jgi:hypothetical protein